MKKRLFKFLSLVLVFLIMINMSISIDTSKDGTFIKFGQNTYAATQTLSFNLNGYALTDPSVTVFDGSHLGNYIDGIVNVYVDAASKSVSISGTLTNVYPFTTLYTMYIDYYSSTGTLLNDYTGPTSSTYSNTFNYSKTYTWNNLSTIVCTLYCSLGSYNAKFYPSRITGTPTIGNYIQKYITVNTVPTISTLSPASNSLFSEVDTSIKPSITVSDNDNGALTCNYYVDSETTSRGTETVTNTSTPKTITFANGINMGTLTEGNHTIRCEVSDGFNTPVSSYTSIRVDKSAPTIGTIPPSSTYNSINVSGSATDSIAGLDSYPYRYTVGSNVSSWLTSSSYTQGSLTPNTQYAVKFEARDAKGHIGASSIQNIYTKAQTPSLAVSNASSYTLDVLTSDNNPTATQYQISVNSGTQYLTQEGALTTSPVWITLTSQKITVTGLTPDTTYSFTAKAKNAEGIETTLSAPASGTTLVAPPGSPTGITATATNTSITLDWDAVTDATGYDVEVDGTTVIDNGTSLTYTHTGLTASTEHSYRIRARNGVVNGNWSNIVTKSTRPNPPDVPVNLNAIPGSTTVTVTWGSVPGATTYEIEVDGELQNAGTNTNYIHSGLLPGTNHTYRVRALNAGGESGWSIEAAVTTSLDSIDTPSNLKAVPSKNKVDVSWNVLQDATGYDIEVDNVVIDNGGRNTFTHNNLEAGTSHSYRIRAKRGSVMSAWSALVPVTTLPDTFGTPANVKAEPQDTSVVLSWDAVSGTTGYEVEFDGDVSDNGLDTDCTIVGLDPNSLHSFKVRAKSGDVTSDWSIDQSFTTYIMPTPANITAIATQTAINLNWNEVTGAESYDIEIDNTDTYNLTVRNYTLDNLTANSQHTFRIRAKNAEGTSAWSKPIIKTTAFNADGVPTGIAAKTRKTSIKLFWKLLAGAAGYDVEVDGGNVVENIAGTSYFHDSLTPGTQHTYRVRARTDTGYGNWSNILAASTLPLLPDVPSNLTASSTATAVKVTWDAIANATGYEIEVDGYVVAVGTETSFAHTGLSPETPHTYRVRAKNITGTGEWSQVISISTKSSVQEFTLDCENGEVFNMVLSASNIDQPGKYTFTISYDADELDVVDLCGTTPKINLSTGSIPGTDINVLQFTPGTILIKISGTAAPGKMWSGIVNTVKFKSKTTGQTSVTFSFN